MIRACTHTPTLQRKSDARAQKHSHKTTVVKRKRKSIEINSANVQDSKSAHVCLVHPERLVEEVNDQVGHALAQLRQALAIRHHASECKWFVPRLSVNVDCSLHVVCELDAKLLTLACEPNDVRDRTQSWIAFLTAPYKTFPQANPRIGPIRRGSRLSTRQGGGVGRFSL